MCTEPQVTRSLGEVNIKMDLRINMSNVYWPTGLRMGSIDRPLKIMNFQIP
jgi:hypothetical protein